MKKVFNTSYLLLAIRSILILSIFNAIYYNLWHILSANILLLALLFLPLYLKNKLIKIPKEFEIFLLFFVIITLLVSKIKWIIAPIVFGIGMSLFGLMILFFLYQDNQIKKNSLLIVLFPFSLTLSIATLIEISKYLLKIILTQELGAGVYNFSMQTLIYVTIGSLISVSLGYFYLKTNFKPIKKIIIKFKSTNKSRFKKTDNSEEIIKLIKKGENQTTEFKSTLRTNIYTQEFDKKIEHAILKTITSFLNSQGGTLLIGVKDNGEILGIEKDRFENNDKFSLHFTNMLKEKIGKKYLPLIDFEIILIKGKSIMKVECSESKKPVFLKNSDNEEFYIRVGPSTQEIKASELIEYIERKFKKN